jgi:succinylglutamate desuccinylase
VIQEVRRFWLGVSAALRRLGFQRIIHWLPGIRRHPRRPGVFVVNPRVARFYAREIFHLLGYRREWERCGLVAMSPRDTVTASLP